MSDLDTWTMKVSWPSDEIAAGRRQREKRQKREKKDIGQSFRLARESGAECGVEEESGAGGWQNKGPRNLDPPVYRLMGLHWATFRIFICYLKIFFIYLLQHRAEK